MACLAWSSGCNMRHRLAHNPGKLSAVAGRATTRDAGVIHPPAGEGIGIGMAVFTG